MGSCRAQAAWACTLSAALCSLWVVSGKSCLIPRDLFLGRVGTVKVSHERWGETETSIFQKKMELDILYGYESKCKAPIHTLNPQADPYPRSIPKRRWSRPFHTSGSPRADPYPNFDATPNTYVWFMCGIRRKQSINDSFQQNATMTNSLYQHQIVLKWVENSRFTCCPRMTPWLIPPFFQCNGSCASKSFTLSRSRCQSPLDLPLAWSSCPQGHDQTKAG